MKKLTLKPGHITLAQLRAVAEHHAPFALPSSAWRVIDASKRAVDKILKKGAPVYGINTGFGSLAAVQIDAARLGELQKNLVLSHAVGVGKPMSDAAVRLMLLLKINALAQGYSGVRREVVELLLALYNKEIYPIIPEKGSVGASGDLAPLAHMSLPLIGEGNVRVKGRVMSSRAALKKFKLKPLTLGPKEGLALLNGTQISTALALLGLFAAENCFAAAVVAGDLSVDAAKGSTTPFDARIHAIRRQKGQIDVARVYRNLMKGSAIRASHLGIDDGKVQDPYSLRCQPQVMGACLDHICFAADIFKREANAVSDNPLVFSGDGAVLSGGNFHAEPVAMAADTLALALAEIGALSERRIAMLIDAKLSGLPPFLVKDAGVNSGFMIAHVTAAALASENKSFAHPACVDSLPTSANQEDHVSMATFAARRLSDMAFNTANIVGVELLASAQGIDFHAPLKTSAPLQRAMKLIRARASFYKKDRLFAPDIAAVSALVQEGAFNALMPQGLLPCR